MEEMFSHREKKKCDSATNTCRDRDRDVAVLNLSVNGAAAFIHSQRPKTFREYRSYRYVREEKRERLERSFPVDRIVYLAERLELTADVSADGPSDRSDDRPASGFSLDLSSITAEEESDDHIEPETHTSVRHSRRDTGDSPKDLINTYMKSVEKERDLSRYFRICGVCGETLCVCAQDDNSEGESKRGRGTRATEGSRRPCYLECCCPDFFEADYLPSVGGEECCCHCRTERDSRNVSDCSDKILAYTSSLANAARSARVLARDLELVLNNFKTE